MTTPTSMAVFSIFLLLSVSALLIVSGSEVVILKDKNFDEFIDQNEYVLVDFFATWCGHCKKLSIELDKAAPLLAAASPPIVVAKVDAEANGKLRQRFTVGQYPTLKLFVKGIARDLEAPNNAELLIDALKREMAPDVTILTSDNEILQMAKKRGNGHLAVFIGFGLEAAQLEKVARSFRKKAWFASAKTFTNETMMVEFDFDRAPALVALHAAGEQEVFYGPFEDEDLEEFVKRAHIPLISVMSELTFPLLSTAGRPLVLILADFDRQAPPALGIDAPDPRQVDSPAGKAVAFVRRVKPVARTMGEFVFAYVDVIEHPTFVAPFGIGPQTPLPAIIVWHQGTVNFYSAPHPEEFLTDNMEFALLHFLQEVKAGKVSVNTTVDPGLWEKAKSFFGSPNFPIVAIIIIFAIIMKCREEGAPIILGQVKGKAYREMKAKAAERKKKQEEEQEGQAKVPADNKLAAAAAAGDIAMESRVEEKPFEEKKED